MNGFVNKYPYTDFHELNIDWLLDTVKKLDTSVQEILVLLEELKKLTPEEVARMIEEAITKEDEKVQGLLNALHVDITTEYKEYISGIETQIKNYVDDKDHLYDAYAQGYATMAVIEAKRYTDLKLMNYCYMYDPITGQYEDVRNVVQHIIEYYHGSDILTAAEYDALDLTATAFEAYDITASQYDLSGKTILV